MSNESNEEDTKFYPVTITLRQLTALRAMIRFQKMLALHDLVIRSKADPSKEENFLLYTLKGLDVIDGLAARVQEAVDVLHEIATRQNIEQPADTSMVDVIWADYELAFMKDVVKMQYTSPVDGMPIDAKKTFALVAEEQEGLQMAFAAAQPVTLNNDGSLDLGNNPWTSAQPGTLQ